MRATFLVGLVSHGHWNAQCSLIHADSHNYKYKLSTPVFVVIMQRFNMKNERLGVVVVFVTSYSQYYAQFALVYSFIRHENIAADVLIRAGLFDCNHMTDVGGARGQVASLIAGVADLVIYSLYQGC